MFLLTNSLKCCIFATNVVFGAMNRIRQVLKERGVKVNDLAKLINKNRSVLSSYCSNSRQPNLETLRIIAYELDVDVRDLIEPTKNVKYRPVYIKLDDGSDLKVGEIRQGKI